MSAENKANVAERYLEQKKITTADIIAYIALGISVVLFLTARGWLFMISFGLIFGSIVAIIAVRGRRVKDSEYDELINKIISDKALLPNATDTFQGYDLKNGRYVLGRDNKLRGELYCISKFKFNGDECRIECSEINAVTQGVKTDTYSISTDTEVEISEEAVGNDAGTRKVSYFSFDCGNGKVSIPFDGRSYDSGKIIEKFGK